MDIVVLGIDLGVRPGYFATSNAAKFGGELRQRTWALHRSDGSVLRRASSGARVRCPGARNASDVAGICAPVCEGAEE
jgi:hypothetical protein